jgi:hypothetical protein
MDAHDGPGYLRGYSLSPRCNRVGKVLQPRQLSQFLWSLRMRGDCRSNDAVDSLTGNLFTP